MKLIDLVGCQLKSEQMIDFMDDHDLEKIVYDIDRLNENIEDTYWVNAKRLGFSLRFNEKQKCDTIFCYIKPNGKYKSINKEIIGINIYENLQDAKDYCTINNVPYESRGTKEKINFFGKMISWLKIKTMPVTQHFEYDNDALSLVTLGLHDQ